LSFYVDTGCNPPGTCTNTPNYDYTITDGSGNVIGSGTNIIAGNGNIVTISPIPFAPAIGGTNYYINAWETANITCTYSGSLATIGNSYLTYGCTDITALNYIPPMPDCDDNSCIATPINFGCMRLSAFNYDPAAANVCDGNFPGCTTVANSNFYNVPACVGPGFGVNGQCCVDAVLGCTDGGNLNPPDLLTQGPNGNAPYANNQEYWEGWGYDVSFNVTNYSGIAASNYNSNANTENGTCDYNTGCTNPAAYSLALLPGYNAYNSNAAIDNGSCCTVQGCTDSLANNYNPNACSDDGSCTYSILGCTNPIALSANLISGYSPYNSNATIDDGSCCLIAGCTDNTQSNYNSNACSDDGSCQPWVYGCTYGPNGSLPAWNSVINDGGLHTASTWQQLYIIPDPGVEAAIYNPVADRENGSCYWFGCMDPTACNYNPAATLDDGSCSLNTPLSLGPPNFGINTPNCLLPTATGTGCGGGLNHVSSGVCAYPFEVGEEMYGAHITKHFPGGFTLNGSSYHNTGNVWTESYHFDIGIGNVGGVNQPLVIGQTYCISWAEIVLRNTNPAACSDCLSGGWGIRRQDGFTLNSTPTVAHINNAVSLYDPLTNTVSYGTSPGGLSTANALYHNSICTTNDINNSNNTNTAGASNGSHSEWQEKCIQFVATATKTRIHMYVITDFDTCQGCTSQGTFTTSPHGAYMGISKVRIDTQCGTCNC